MDPRGQTQGQRGIRGTTASWARRWEMPWTPRCASEAPSPVREAMLAPRPLRTQGCFPSAAHWRDTRTRRRSCCLGGLGKVRQDVGERDAHGAPAVRAGEAAGGRRHRAQGVVPLRGPLLLGEGRLPGQRQARPLQDGAVVAAVSGSHREKAVRQEAIVDSCCSCPRGAEGLGRCVGTGQQGPGVLSRGQAASHRGCAKAQEGLAARGAQSFRRLRQRQHVAVERGLELGRRETRPPGAGAVLARARELAGAGEASRGPAAPQQGLRGFGAGVHPLVLGGRGAVQEAHRSEGVRDSTGLSHGQPRPPRPGPRAAPADLSLREPGLLLAMAQEDPKARGKDGAEGLGPTGLSDIPTE